MDYLLHEKLDGNIKNKDQAKIKATQILNK